MTVELLTDALTGGASSVGVTGVTGVTGVVAAWLRSRGEGARSRGCRRMADRLGMAYCHRLEPPVRAWFLRLPVFHRHEQALIRNAMRGRYYTSEMRLLDWCVDAPEERSRTTIALFRLEHNRVPRFVVRPRSQSQTSGEPRNFHRVDLPCTAAFNEHFTVRGVNRAAIVERFHRTARQQLINHPTVSIDAGGRWLAVYVHGSRPPLSELPRFMRDAFLIFQALRLR